jgi:hypothetical protein
MGLAGVSSRSAGLRIAVALLPPDPRPCRGPDPEVPGMGQRRASRGGGPLAACARWTGSGRVISVRQEPAGGGVAVDGLPGPGAARPPGDPQLLAPWRSTLTAWPPNLLHRMPPCRVSVGIGVAHHQHLQARSRILASRPCGAAWSASGPAMVVWPAWSLVMRRPSDQVTSRCPARPGRGARSSPVARQASHLHSAGRMAWSQLGGGQGWCLGGRRASCGSIRY